MATPTATSPVEATATPQIQSPVHSRRVGPVVAFIIGLCIVLLASVLNAAGLNLTKLDHVSNYGYR